MTIVLDFFLLFFPAHLVHLPAKANYFQTIVCYIQLSFLTFWWCFYFITLAFVIINKWLLTSLAIFHLNTNLCGHRRFISHDSQVAFSSHKLCSSCVYTTALYTHPSFGSAHLKQTWLQGELFQLCGCPASLTIITEASHRHQWRSKCLKSQLSV